MLKRAACILTLALLCAACGRKGHHDIKRVAGAEDTRLDPAGAVVVATPEDGAYQTKVYPGSGAKTLAAVKTHFERHASRVVVVDDCAELACLRETDGVYYVVPQLVSWEDRMAFSSTPDRFEIKMTVYDSAGEALDAVVFDSASATRRMYQVRPEDMLDAALGPYIAKLYGAEWSPPR